MKGSFTTILVNEKISSPSAGLNARNPRDSVAGAHPVLRLELLAGFSHPRNPRISRIPSALIASGKQIFSLSTKRILLENSFSAERREARKEFSRGIPE